MSPRINRRLEAERARLAAIDAAARLEAAERRSAGLRPPPKPNRGGRPRALTPRQVKWVRALRPVRGDGTLERAAARLKVSLRTIYAVRASAPSADGIDPERLAAAERRSAHLRPKSSSPPAE